MSMVESIGPVSGPPAAAPAQAASDTLALAAVAGQILIPGESLGLIASSDPAQPANLVRTQTQNPERTGADNPGLPGFDGFGLRPGYGGTGYLDINGGDIGDQASATFTAEAGTYALTIRLANGTQGARPVALRIDGVETLIADTRTGQWTQWETRTIPVTLTTSGPHTLTIVQPTGEGAPNIDAIVLHPPDAPPDFAPAPDPDPDPSNPDPSDTSADEDGNLALAPVASMVTPEGLAAVPFRISGVDADIQAYEFSMDDGVTFHPAIVLPDGADQIITVNLASYAGATSAPLHIRVTDDAGNQETRSASVAVGVPPGDIGPPTFQAEDAARVTVQDSGTGDADPTLTRVVDPTRPDAYGFHRAGAVGDAYMDLGANPGDGFTLMVEVATAGTYTASIRYANGASPGAPQGGSRPLLLSVNGEAGTLVDFPRTAGTGGEPWEAWTELDVVVTLAAGSNALALSIPTAAQGGQAGGPNIDQITLTPGAAGPVPPEPGPRQVIKVNFQDGTQPKAPGYLVDSFQGFGDRGNGYSYGWVTEASATDADGGTATPINPGQFPPSAVFERSGGVFDGYDPRLTGYAHFDLVGYASRTAWELALPDGWYEVTVSVGDTGGPNDSSNRLFVEGALATAWVPTNSFKSQLVTTLAKVEDGFLTLSAQGGTVTEMQYLEVRALPDLTPGDGREAPADYASFFDARAISGVGSGQVSVDLDPGDGVRPDNVSPGADIFLGINVVAGRGGALLGSLQDGSIRLVETLTGQPVAFTANTTGGFDSLTISPTSDLKPFTSYTLMIDGFRDRGANDDLSAATREFQKFTTSFTTGAAAPVAASAVAFNDVVQVNSNPKAGEIYTSVELSPDGRFLYVTGMTGTLTRWSVDPATGALDPASKEVFAPGGDFNADGGRRGIVGIAFDPENPNVIWVTDNHPIPLSGQDNGVPDFSGRLSKVVLGPGGSLKDAGITPYLTGLPRSNGDHLTNSLEFRANPKAGQPGEPGFLLYLAQGSNTAMGDADSAWGLRPERLLSAAVLEVDHTRTAPAGGFDVRTEPLPTDGLNRRFADPDGDLKNGGIAITSGPYAGKYLHFAENGVASVRDGLTASSALVKTFYDPFAPDAVAGLFATGLRNAYDLVWHSNGFLYAPGNGSAAGGNIPDNPDTGADEGITNVGKQQDYLFRVVDWQAQGMAGPRYYGHPNPVRNEFVMNGGNPTGGTDPNQVSAYPVGTQPDPDYDLPGTYALGENRSPNGVIEYKSNVFGSSLKGAVLFTEYSGGDDIRAVLLDGQGKPVPGKDFTLQSPDGSKISYTDPLDIVEGADGRLYLLTLNRSTGVSQIVKLDPAVDAPGADIAVVSQDPTFYDDRLHFSWIDDPDATTPAKPDRDYKDSGTVTVSNTGTAPLTISGAELTGPFTLAAPGQLNGLTLQPGQSVAVTVSFNRAAHTPTADGVNGVYEGTLTIISNDADTPRATIDLAGFWQQRDEGGWEPNVNEVWEIFGFGNVIEGLSLLGGGERSVLSTNDVFARTDETEVLSPYWRLADGVTQARITQIAAFHGDGGATIGIHAPGNKSAHVIFWNHDGNDNQTLLPLKPDGSFATQLFGNSTIPDGWSGNEIFGIEVDNLSTDPRLNPSGGVKVPGAQQGHTVKMFQALDKDGKPIPNVFLGAMDYTGINYDYNDNLFIIEGVTPVFFGDEPQMAAADVGLIGLPPDPGDGSGG